MASPLSDTDLFYFSLGGLGPDYESFITTVSLQAEDLPFEELSSLLRSHEVRLSSLHTDVTSAAALVASGPSFSTPNSSPPRGFSQHHLGRGRGKGCGQGFSSARPSYQGPSSTPSQGRPTCQVCNKPSHVAIDCYNRLNMAYQGRNPSRQLAAMHLTAATPTGWLTDSGATHHVTPDASILSSHSNYAGPDRCMVGDGSGLRISSIGSTSLSAPHSILKLRCVLHVPTISKN